MKNKVYSLSALQVLCLMLPTIVTFFIMLSLNSGLETKINSNKELVYETRDMVMDVNTSLQEKTQGIFFNGGWNVISQRKAIIALLDHFNLEFEAQEEIILKEKKNE